jgi:hypothetical protein
MALEKDISNQGTPPQGGDRRDLYVDDFRRAFGENFIDAIDINTWSIGANLSELYPVVEQEWLKAKTDENNQRRIFRDYVFPRIKANGNVPFAGLNSQVEDVKQLLGKMHRGFLFNGAVTACSSIHAIFNTVPLSISQIGVCLINYEKQHGSYSHRLFSRDLRFKSDDPVQEVLDLIEKRKTIDNAGDARAAMSNLAVRGIRAFVERAILMDKRSSQSKWILGNGDPTPYELMMGFWGSQKEMMNRSIELMSRMVIDHQRFVYVHSCERFPDLWTLGNALLPFEFLILGTLEEDLVRRVELGGTRNVIRDAYTKFAREVGSKIVRGIYKVSHQAQPQIFYGHIDHIRTAALIAMADSVFQLHIGRPMLLDLASNLCDISFSKSELGATIEQAALKAEIKLRPSSR